VTGGTAAWLWLSTFDDDSWLPTMSQRSLRSPPAGQ